MALFRTILAIGSFALPLFAQQIPRPVHTSITVNDSVGYLAEAIRSAMKTSTALRDTPQSITVVTAEQIEDQGMRGIGDVMRYVPGITAIQGENNRDQLVIRGNSTSADFFLDGTRDDVQYYRDLYNVERLEALKGPNALIFGRGGGGGVINRVSKQADFSGLREVRIDGGSYGGRRVSADFDQAFRDRYAFRMTGVYEGGDSFRDGVSLLRFGVSPSFTWLAAPNTKIVVNYENFHDQRTADRGQPSFLGRPLEAPASRYFGDPADSHVRALVNSGSVTLDTELGRWHLRNRALVGDYDRGYRNYVPGAIAGTNAVLSAYNNATARRNLFNQTDLSARFRRHSVVAGVEVGRQLTDNFRNTGYFNGTATSIFVPVANGVITAPATFRQSATDADNHVTTNLAAAYIQDQINVFKQVQIVAGVRVDRFDLNYRNNRNGDRLQRADNVISPRLGLVYGPVQPVSLYASYSISYLPSSGDQFSSLTTITQQVKPEKFTNYEVGVKWDATKALAFTAAIYRLDRTNTRSTDPNDPTRILQTGSQRTDGAEFGLTGRLTRAWNIAGGFAIQNARITSATASAFAGATVAQVPRNTFSLWNNVQITRRVGAGLGVLNRSTMFAAINDTVRLPGYWRADAAVFFRLTEMVRLQTNIENVFNRRYTLNADNNNNLSPGSPRAFRVGLAARF